jgi:peptidylprolyl isomerase
MNIPKPAIYIGLVALIGAYVATRSASERAEPGAAPSAETHTHEDGTVHEGATHGGEAAPASDPSTASGSGNAPGADMAGVTDTGKLQKIDLKKGTGKEARNGSTVSVHYRGTLLSGAEFDSSYGRGEPFEFSLPGQVIEGWNQGVPGMKVGGKRRLIIPAELAYGAQSPSPKIPANSPLVFEIELIDVK